MKARCYNPNVKAYPNYGGRGIIVCNEWLHDAKSFCDWATDNGYEDTKSIDRINVNGNYCPENCRWVTWNEQCRNTRQNHLVTLGNKRMCLSDWAHESGISVQTAIKRLQSGWSIEKTLGLQPRKIEVLK
jgi:hypothetical protein